MAQDLGLYYFGDCVLLSNSNNKISPYWFSFPPWILIISSTK